MAEPAGFHRRDTILVLFWPDLTAARARAALRKSLHVLRATLGPEVIVTRGDDEVGIDWRYLRCDVAHFSRALLTGEVATALELYRADLLTGFHLNDSSPEWEQWLDGHRAALRRSAASAAWAHAKSLAETGDVPGAIHWARWACTRTPDDEPAVRKLLGLLGALGDRAGALHCYEEFRTKLRSEYGAQPAPETQELIRDIRSRAEVMLPGVPRPDAPADIPAEPTPPSPPDQTATRHAPAPTLTSARWPRRARVAIPVLALLVLAALLWNRGSALPVEPNLVAVAPFTILSPELQVWEEGLVDVLARNLDHAGPLRALPASRAIRMWRDAPPGTSGAEALGEHSGAGVVITGSLLGLAGDSVRVMVTVLDQLARSSLGDLEVTGAVARMDVVIDSVTRGVLRLIGNVRQIGSARYAGIGARSVPALKAFLQGEQYRRRSSWDSARTSYEESLALDSTFALTWLRLGEVNHMSRFPVPLQNGAQDDSHLHLLYRAGAFNHGLSPHDSLGVFIISNMAALGTRRVPADQAVELTNRVVNATLEATRLYPNDPEAWYWRGAAENALDGAGRATWEEAYASLQRATALDSGFTPAYRAALLLAGRVGDVDGTRRLSDHYLTLEPTGAVQTLGLAITTLLRPGATNVASQRTLDALPPDVLWPLLLGLWRLPDSQGVAIQVARTIHSQGHDPRYWFTADPITRRDLAAVLAYRGQFGEALTLAGSERSTWFANLFGELAAFGAIAPGHVDSVFGDWLTNSADTPGLKEAPSWWAGRGDAASIRRWMASRSSGGSRVDSAYLALALGDSLTAARAFRAAPFLDFRSSLTLVQLLTATGATTEALAILKGREPLNWPIPSHVAWVLLRARLLERTGDRHGALRDFRFVADVWMHADPALQPFVTEAREQVRSLSGSKPLRDAARTDLSKLPGRRAGTPSEGRGTQINPSARP